MLLPLLFHFNQHLSEQALLASHVCYRGLLRVLRANPSIKANIHISGTLITALKWLDPEPLELIRDGLADGQFEIVGSTFAQNVLYSSDDWDNARQIELHKQVIEDTFGVTPTAFWNVERCWRQSLVPVIAGGGYKTITIEDHILEKSGGTQAVVYRTRQAEAVLNVVRDDEKLKHLFNFAAWFGDTRPLHAYLDSLPAPGGKGRRSKTVRGSVLAYAEDAEALGLWGYYEGIIPTQTWGRLDILFKELATRKNLTTVLFSEIPEPAEETSSEISPIADGAAAWMNASLAQAGLPYHEDGYKNWFDFNTNSPKLAEFRQFYKDLRSILRKRETDLGNDAIQNIYTLALHTFLTHQYEFGCIGIGDDSYRGWLGAHAVRVLDSCANLANPMDYETTPLKFTVVDEINKDGIEEWEHLDQNEYMILSPVGGRLLYWLDLSAGQMLIGNPSAVVPGSYEGDSVPPRSGTHPNFWLPDNNATRPVERTEQPPTRMAKFLPEWVWEAEANPVTLAMREMRLAGEAPFLTAHQGAFCDDILLDGMPVFTRWDKMEAEGSREGVRFTYQLSEDVVLTKKYAFNQQAASVEYDFSNKGLQNRAIRMTTISELALDYAAILQHGRAALDFLSGDASPDQPGVVNPLTGETLTLSASRSSSEVIRTQALLGLNVGLKFEFELPAGHSEGFIVQLVRSGDSHF